MPRVIRKVTPRPPGPRAGIERRIQRAIAFVKERAAHHSHAMYLEVGEHLFVGLFLGDEKLYAARGSWGRAALVRVAGDPGVHMSADQLYAAVHMYILETRYRSRTRVEPPLLTPWMWDRLWVLEKNPEAMMAVADWAASGRVGLDLMMNVARLVKPVLDAGGRLEDLLVTGDAGPETPVRRMNRLLDMLESWVRRDRASYGPKLRRELLALIDDLIAT